MNKRFALTFCLFFILLQPVMADGIVKVSSDFNVEQTANRMEKILVAKGMTIFNRINHSQAAEKVGIKLRPTELLIFGNPKAGSPLMQCQQQVAIDLPQKALIWEDKENKVWISYNDPEYLARRHNITGCEEAIDKIKNALAGISAKAASE